MCIRLKIEVLRVNITNPVTHWTKYFGHFSCCFQNSRGPWYTCCQVITLIDNNIILRSQERRTAVLELKCAFKLGVGANPKFKIFVPSFMQFDSFIQNALGTFPQRVSPNSDYLCGIRTENFKCANKLGVITRWIFDYQKHTALL
jgi:hypothetical protein